MKLREYTDCCLRFAAETKSWSALDPYKFYTTSRLDSWEESCDNASGGLDLSWAFHLPEEDIRSRAPQLFLQLLTESLEQGLDEEYDAAQWASAARDFT